MDRWIGGQADEWINEVKNRKMSGRTGTLSDRMCVWYER